MNQPSNLPPAGHFVRTLSSMPPARWSMPPSSPTDSTRSVRSSLLPPVRPTQPPDTDPQGLRGTDASSEVFRELYKWYAVLIHQYSQKLDTMDSKKIKYLLEVQCQELEHSDPLIGLLVHLENHQSEDVEVGAYKIVSPSIKSLNSSMGPIFTDIFAAKLHGAIEAKFKNNDVKILHTRVQGGTFVSKKSQAPAAVVELEKEATQALLETLKAKKDQIEATKNKRANRTLNSEEAAQLEKIEKLIAEIESGTTKVHLALGKSDLASKKPEKGSLAIHHAQLAANYQASQIKKGTIETKEIKSYDEAQIIYEYLKAHQELRTNVLTEDGQVKEEWKEFFYTTSGGKLRMQEKAIKSYREASEEAKAQEKMKFFGDYYATINMVDVLKPWTFQRYGAFIKQIKRRVRLIKKYRKAATNNWKEAKVRHLGNQVFKEVAISVKDQGEKIIGNTRGQISALLEDDQLANQPEETDTVILSGDHIGFGAINQEDYQESLEKLVDLLQLSDEEKQAPDKTTIEAKIQQLRENGGYQQFTKIVQSIGDKGTERIVETKKILHENVSTAGGTIEIDGSAGDEEKAIIRGLTLEKVRAIITETLGERPIRIAIAKAPGQLPRIPSDQGPPKKRPAQPWQDPVEISQKLRSSLKTLFELYQGLQTVLDTMKTNENQHGVQILEQAA